VNATRLDNVSPEHSDSPGDQGITGPRLLEPQERFSKEKKLNWLPLPKIENFPGDIRGGLPSSATEKKGPVADAKKKSVSEQPDTEKS